MGADEPGEQVELIATHTENLPFDGRRPGSVHISHGTIGPVGFPYGVWPP